MLSVEEYLNKIGPHIKNIIKNLKKSGTWKIQLTIVNNFFSSIDNDEDFVMHSKGDNIEIIINGKADQVIKKLFDSLKNRYPNNLELMKGSEFTFHYVQLLYYKCCKKSQSWRIIYRFSWLGKKQKSNNRYYQ